MPNENKLGGSALRAASKGLPKSSHARIHAAVSNLPAAAIPPPAAAAQVLPAGLHPTRKRSNAVWEKKYSPGHR